mmetsp:Transcript_37456/g.79009  ORF Transcript_37456/g.79009 Transcript_37456/m.79009 type:complete len:400 (+) Transcript_37456:47-1246(+)
MSSGKSRIVLSKSLNCYEGERGQKRHDDEVDDADVLNLMMICCEERAPYGPAAVTANMFLELFCEAYKRYYHEVSCCAPTGEERSSARHQSKHSSIRITIYHAQSLDYPRASEEWDSYDGVIIPGSFSTAYETHIEWIHRLQEVIQQEIHGKRRKALGVCFGHQCFAHSFGLRSSVQSDHQVFNESGTWQQSKSIVSKGGLASKCTVGPIAGRKSFQLTDGGKILLGSAASSRPKKNSHEKSNIAQPLKDCLELLYTRGDMVQSLPSVGISLCGNEKLPNEACAYFASETDVMQFQNDAMKQCSNLSPLGEASTSWGQVLDKTVLPYAITFQAHPEYVTQTGRKVNYVNTVKAMEEHGIISEETAKVACEDAIVYYNALSGDSLDAIVSVGVILGWFRQ